MQVLANKFREEVLAHRSFVLREVGNFRDHYAQVQAQHRRESQVGLLIESQRMHGMMSNVTSHSYVTL